MFAFVAFDERFVSFLDLSDEFVFVSLADLRAAHLAFRSKLVQTCLQEFFVFGLELLGRQVRLVCSTQLRGGEKSRLFRQDICMMQDFLDNHMH